MTTIAFVLTMFASRAANTNDGLRAGQRTENVL